MTEVENYAFMGPDGPLNFLDLFAGRSQLIVHHQNAQKGFPSPVSSPELVHVDVDWNGISILDGGCRVIKSAMWRASLKYYPCTNVHG